MASSTLQELLPFEIGSADIKGLEFKDEDIRGSGAYAAVYVVSVRGTSKIAKRLRSELVGTDVNQSEKQRIREQFLNECLLLSKLDHPNVVKFVGVHFSCQDRSDVTLIMERLHMDLDKFLDPDQNPNIDTFTKLSILLDVSSGLLYLHTQLAKPIIHCDLTAGNVLLTENFKQAKIADLIVSKLVDNHWHRAVAHTACPGSFAYMPPEALTDNPRYDTPLDIFSFGILSLYTALQQFPQVAFELSHEQSIRALQLGEAAILKRKKWLDKLPEDHCLRDLILSCLKDDPSERPSTKRLNKKMKELQLDIARKRGHFETVNLLEREDHTTPLGHILTNLELQVLASLLDTNSDEKLQEILLSIQKKQYITREEVETSLRQIGLESVASDLKNNIEKGVENLKHYEAYEQALNGDLSLTLCYLKFLFFGPPRSGKTSTRRRLIKQIVNLSQFGVSSKSTGVAETNDVIIKKLTSEPAAFAGSQWWSMKRSKEGTQLDMYDEDAVGYLAQLFYQLIYKSTLQATSRELITVQDSNEHSAAEVLNLSNSSTIATAADHKTERKEQNEQIEHEAESINESEMLESNVSDAEEAEIKIAFEKLTSILQSDSPEDLKRLLEDLTMINMTDVGGQPAFLDMLPALTIGPALYFLFFRLDQELRKKYPVRFHAADSEHEVTLESSYCIEEVLYQCLSSIACFSCQQRAEMATMPQASSGALLFGTYKDRVNDSQISQIEDMMEEHFKGTKLYQEGLLLKSLHGKMVITVDNMFGTDESEMSDIRKDIEAIIKNFFPATPIPISWLMFGIVIQLLNKPVVSLAQCDKIAKQLSMTSPVQEALWFFHHNIGSLMHYNILSMEDTVICNPQVIFDSISKLIIDKFKHGNRALKPGAVDEFQQKGLFTLSHIQDKTEHQQRGLLKLNQLVDVLKHLNILAEVRDMEECSSDQPEPKFIMPAILKHASEKELSSLSSAASEHAVPLFIHFEMGFVPFGVFCASVAHFISHQNSMLPRWKLCDDQLRRNVLKFVIDESFFTTLISRPQHIEVHVERHPLSISKNSISFICSTVRQIVVETLKTVISKMKYKPFKTPLFPTEQPFNIAFTCCLDDSHSDHLMIVNINDSERQYHAKCPKSYVTFRLSERQLLWFDKGEDSRNICTDQAIPKLSRSDSLKLIDLHIIQSTTWEARSHWYNMGLALGISADTLDAIKSNNRDVCEDCYTTILKQWLKHPRPTLSALAEALRSPAVNMAHLAEQLANILTKCHTTTLSQ